MTWFTAIRDIWLNGAKLASSDAIEFLTGFSVVKDPTTGRIQVTNTGGGGGGGSGDVVGPGVSVDDRVALFSGVTGKLLKQASFLIGDLIKKNGSVPFAADQSMGGFKLTDVKSVTYGAAPYDNGNSGVADTIDWGTNGDVQKSTLNGACAYAFVAPAGVSGLTLEITTAGGFLPTWDALVDWPYGTPPTLAAGTHVMTFYWNGTRYRGYYPPAAAVSSGVGGGDGFRFTYSATTADADPGAGTLRLNNAVVASVTQLYVDLSEYGGTDVTAWLDSLDDAAVAVLGRVRIQSISDPAKWALFNLTGWTTAAGYRKLTVTHVASPAGVAFTAVAGDTFLSFDRAGGVAVVGTTLTLAGSSVKVRDGAAPGQQGFGFWDGAAWQLVGGVTGSALADASVTLQFATANQYFWPAATNTTAIRTLTLGTTGLAAGPNAGVGAIVDIEVWRSLSHNVLVANGGGGGGTLFTLPSGSSPVAMSFFFDGTNWSLAGWKFLGTITAA